MNTPKPGDHYCKGRTIRYVKEVVYQKAMFGEPERFVVVVKRRKRPIPADRWTEWVSNAQPCHTVREP